MEFDTKDTFAALDFENQGKNEYGDSVKISESQITEN